MFATVVPYNEKSLPDAILFPEESYVNTENPVMVSGVMGLLKLDMVKVVDAVVSKPEVNEYTIVMVLEA